MTFSFLIDPNLLQINTCFFSFHYASGEAESSGIIYLGAISNILSEIGEGGGGGSRIILSYDSMVTVDSETSGKSVFTFKRDYEKS